MESADVLIAMRKWGHFFARVIMANHIVISEYVELLLQVPYLK